MKKRIVFPFTWMDLKSINGEKKQSRYEVFYILWFHFHKTLENSKKKVRAIFARGWIFGRIFTTKCQSGLSGWWDLYYDYGGCFTIVCIFKSLNSKINRWISSCVNYILLKITKKQKKSECSSEEDGRALRQPAKGHTVVHLLGPKSLCASDRECHWSYWIRWSKLRAAWTWGWAFSCPRSHSKSAVLSPQEISQSNTLTWRLCCLQNPKRSTWHRASVSVVGGAECYNLSSPATDIISTYPSPLNP
jgi:hypothetical protein